MKLDAPETCSVPVFLLYPPTPSFLFSAFLFSPSCAPSALLSDTSMDFYLDLFISSFFSFTDSQKRKKNPLPILYSRALSAAVYGPPIETLLPR